MAPNAGGFDQGWSVNDPCFFKDEARGWILGRVTKVVGVGRTATLSLASTDGKVTAERDASAVEAASERAREGVEDMVALDELTEATVLSTLRVRYDRKQIYTNVGGILVAVNPYETIANVYGEDRMAGAAAADAAFSGAAPHPFVMAEQALRALDRDRASQSFVISGESGSGKVLRGNHPVSWAWAPEIRFPHRQDRDVQVHPAVPVVPLEAALRARGDAPGRRERARGERPAVEPGPRGLRQRQDAAQRQQFALGQVHASVRRALERGHQVRRHHGLPP